MPNLQTRKTLNIENSNAVPTSLGWSDSITGVQLNSIRGLNISGEETVVAYRPNSGKASYKVTTVNAEVDDLTVTIKPVFGRDVNLNDIEKIVYSIPNLDPIEVTEGFIDDVIFTVPKEGSYSVTIRTHFKEETPGEPVVLPETPDVPNLTPTVSITDVDDLQSTIDAANEGDVIFLSNGTYEFTENLVINKSVSLVGESKEGVVLIDTRGNSQSFTHVTANNVTLKDLTVDHVTTESHIGTAIMVSSGLSSRSSNFRSYNVHIKYSKTGVSLRSDNYLFQGCTFEVAGGSGTRRGLMPYGHGGVSFVKDCIFINETTGALRSILLGSTTGNNEHEEQNGTLVVDGSTFVGSLSQFINIENHQGNPDSFRLIVMNNITPETNAFVVAIGGVVNFADLYSEVVLINNHLTNVHHGTGGKGVFGLTAYSEISARSEPLRVVAVDNVLSQLPFRDQWSESEGSVGSLVGYTVNLTNTDVDLVTDLGSEEVGEPKPALTTMITKTVVV